MNVNDSRMADYLAAIDTELELFGSRWPVASYEGTMHSSHFFHRDPADAFYTDRYEDNAPDCPICDRPLDVLQTGMFCPDCNVAFDDRADIERVRADLAAAPFYGN